MKKQQGVNGGWKDIKHFKPADFACKCGDCNHVASVNMSFVEKLDQLKERLELPVNINSACRCLPYNQSVGGAATSPHVAQNGRDSCAVDIFVPNAQYRAKLLALALEIGFSGIGIGPGGAPGSWVHLDDLPRGDHVVWVYPPSRRR